MIAENRETIGDRVKELRTCSGTTLQEMEDMWKIGHRSTLSELENGNGGRKYTAEQLFKIADLFGTTMEYLYTGIKTRHDYKATIVRKRKESYPPDHETIIKHDSRKVEFSTDIPIVLIGKQHESAENWTVVEIEKC